MHSSFCNFIPCSSVLKKANQWLKKHTEYKLKKVQSVDVAVPYTSLNLNANTAATDFYIDHGSKFYSRSLRLVIEFSLNRPEIE